MIDWPELLVDKIARRNVVILIGSGVSANAQSADGARPPTWYSFLLDAKRRLDRCPKYLSAAINQYNYLDACEYLRRLHGDRWVDIVNEAFNTPNYRPASIHEHIFNLDSRIVCSLNFDRIYDNFATIKSEGTYITKNYWNEDIGSITSGPERYLIKLHGSIDDPEKLIFSTKDYARARNKFPNFYGMLDSLVFTHSFFIIGCGLSDPDIQLIFENYRYRYNNVRSHYMTSAKPIHSEQSSLVRENRGINIIPYSSNNNHEELTDSLAHLVKIVNSRRDEIAEKQSW